MDEHTITPPPELVQEWASESLATQNLCNRAAQWGADQELEACEQAVIDRKWFADPKFWLAELHNARRPKPPSLKEQALGMLENAWNDGHIRNEAAQTIRRALEQLPE